MEIHLLLVFMIAAAIIAVEVKDLLSGVIAIGAVGIGLSMAFLVLKAPDLAMMQLVVEILSLIILISATIHKDLPFSASGRWVFNTTVTIIFMAIFLTSAHFILRHISRFGKPLMNVSNLYLSAGSRDGLQNIVAAITLDFRAMDTLGEATALFAAIIGILAVARKVGHKKEL